MYGTPAKKGYLSGNRSPQFSPDDLPFPAPYVTRSQRRQNARLRDFVPLVRVFSPLSAVASGGLVTERFRQLQSTPEQTQQSRRSSPQEIPGTTQSD